MNVVLVFLTPLLFWLSFPKPDLGFCAYFSLIPLLFQINKMTVSPSPLPLSLWERVGVRGKCLALGWLHGFAAYSAILYWIVPTVTAAGQTLWLGLFALFCLAAYLAVYTGLFSLIISYSLPLSIPLPVPVFGAAIWVTLEYARTYFLTGFPWALLGYTQWKYLPLIQISEFTGVYGVSFLVVLVNLCMYRVVARFIGRRSNNDAATTPDKSGNYTVLPSLLFLLFTLGFGVWKLGYLNGADAHGDNQGIKIAILQGNIDQYKKWDEAYTDEIMDTYTVLARETADFSPDMVVWPETAVPGWLPQEHKYLEWVRQAVKLAGGWHLVGTPSANRGKDYNSAFLFGPEGFIAAEYHKNHLVPFGETIPLRAVLSPWIRVLNELGDFDAGASFKPLYSDVADIGANICFEAIFPDLVRKFVNNGADVLVNITNDAWYLDTAGPYQHFIMNVFRAVENRRVFVRAANTGISGVIDQYGRIIAKSPLLKRGVVHAEISLDATRKTFYTKHGDIFAWSCVLVAFFGIITKLRRMVV